MRNSSFKGHNHRKGLDKDQNRMEIFLRITKGENLGREEFNGTYKAIIYY